MLPMVPEASEVKGVCACECGFSLSIDRFSHFSSKCLRRLDEDLRCYTGPYTGWKGSSVETLKLRAATY